jgi:hypothetical protein
MEGEREGGDLSCKPKREGVELEEIETGDLKFEI